MTLRDPSRPGVTAVAAVAAGPLLALSSGLQLLTDVQQSDGRVLQPWLFAALLTLWALGMACVAVAARGIVALHSGALLGRGARTGGRLVVAGAVLQSLFALAAGATALATGRPADAAFLLFALGFLGLVVGGALLGRGVRRAGRVRGVGTALLCGALAGLLAVLVGQDPWHDLLLFGYDLGWWAAGLVLLGAARADAEPVLATGEDGLRPGR